MKILCKKCAQIATWTYLGSRDYDEGWCDNCVHRGCSCNIDIETGIESVDEKGRLYPCCEYDYDKNGFDLEEDRHEVIETIKEIRERLREVR